MGALEDLYDRVTELESNLVKLCRRTGHGEYDGHYPRCVQHARAKVDGYDETCSTCGAYRCCEEGEARS